MAEQIIEMMMPLIKLAPTITIICDIIIVYLLYRQQRIICDQKELRKYLQRQMDDLRITQVEHKHIYDNKAKSEVIKPKTQQQILREKSNLPPEAYDISKILNK